jgi:hypothetical protein
MNYVNSKFVFIFMITFISTSKGFIIRFISLFITAKYITPVLENDNWTSTRASRDPEKTHDFWQSVDFYSFHMRKFSLRLEPAASEVKGKCANHFATKAPESGSPLPRCLLVTNLHSREPILVAL